MCLWSLYSGVNDQVTAILGSGAAGESLTLQAALHLTR